MRHRTIRPAWVAAITTFSIAVASAQQRPVPDTYTAVTSNMSPEGVELKADVLTWSDLSARAAFIDALGAEDVAAALSELPSVGVVWRSGSAVGTSIKYSQREQLPDGGERVVLATDKRIGATSFEPWTAGRAEADALEYTVIELTIEAGGAGSGTMSFRAPVVIDEDSSTIALQHDGSPGLLEDARLAPKPYWAGSD